jgi:antitoxin component YwqK of YwqJK toxin-antitoxin module
LVWEEQRWNSPEEKDFWLAIPDWGLRELEHYQFRYDQRGVKINSWKSDGYTGFARGYFFEEGVGFFRVVVQAENGLVKMAKISDPSGGKHNLRSYSKGVLSGRYIDWYPNGKRWRDGYAEQGEKEGLWTEWHANGAKKEEGEWENGKPVGVFEEWYENGQKATEQIFKRGKLTFGLVWKPDGELCKKSRVEKEHGILINYNLDGEVVEELVIKYGKKVAF